MHTPTFSLPAGFLNQRVNVTLIGAGGNGSQMLYGLARLHFALTALGHPFGLHVDLFDDDVVSEANISRQLFSPSDLGQSKAITLVHRLNTFYGLNWFAYPERLGSKRNSYPEDAETPHLLIGCVDSAASRRIIHDFVRKENCWWLDLGNSATSGQVVLGCFEESNENDAVVKPPVVTELYPNLRDARIKEDNAPSCSVQEALTKQDLFINQTVASFALHLLWQWFRKGELDHHGYFINLGLGLVSPLGLDPATWERLRRANGCPAEAAPIRKRLQIYPPYECEITDRDWTKPRKDWLYTDAP